MFSERIIDERTVIYLKKNFLKNTVKPLKAVFMVDQKKIVPGRAKAEPENSTKSAKN